MRIRGMGRVRRVLQPVVNLFSPRLIILVYHRVIDLPSDPQLLCVKRKHFEEHLEVLRKRCYPTRLQKIGPAVEGKRLHRPVIMTFDDGYADNLLYAKPLLERYDVPATVFVTSGYVGQKRSFWWDQLENVLLHSMKIPEQLDLTIAEKYYHWELGASAQYTHQSYEAHRDWNLSEKNNANARQLVYRSLHQLLRPISEKARRKALDDLTQWANADVAECPNSSALSPGELTQLAEKNLIEIGAHTVTHPMLSALSPQEQMTEIRQSKTDLEDLLGRPVTSFAYPYGSATDYTEESVAAAQRTGFLRACSNFPGVVGRDTDRFQLPRFLVRDWNGDEFDRRLRDWLCA